MIYRNNALKELCFCDISCGDVFKLGDEEPVLIKTVPMWVKEMPYNAVFLQNGSPCAVPDYIPVQKYYGSPVVFDYRWFDNR